MPPTSTTTTLGRTLDTLWATGLERVYGAVISRAIQHYTLALVRLHTDATSLKVTGPMSGTKRMRARSSRTATAATIALISNSCSLGSP